MTYGLGQVPIGASAAISAANYIKSKVREFNKLGSKLHARQMEAADVARTIQARGGDASNALQSVQEFSALKMDWADVKAKLDSLIEKVPGLGAIPIATALAYSAVLIAVATAIALILRKANTAEKALDLVEKGELTPEEARRIVAQHRGGAFGGLADTAKWIALAVGAVLLTPLLLKPSRRTW